MISKDIEKFEREIKNVISKMDFIEKSCNDKKVLEMLNQNGNLENFKKIFTEVQYLSQLGKQADIELLLYETYEGTL